MEKIVLLLSGGLDSSTLFAVLNKQSAKVLPLYIDYGQRNKKPELKAARYIAKYFGAELYILKAYPDFTDSLLMQENASQSAFLPHRNLLLLTLGAIYAYNNGSNAIAVALHNGTGYSDSTQSFVQQAKKSLEESIGQELIVYTPFINKSKSEVSFIAYSLKVPINRTYSCYIGHPEHCKTCGACIQRFEALKEAEQIV